jgi:hypothetical protein
MEEPRLRESSQVRVKTRSVGAVSFRQVAPWRIQDTGYSIEDTGIEGCKCKDAG